MNKKPLIDTLGALINKPEEPREKKYDIMDPIVVRFTSGIKKEFMDGLGKGSYVFPRKQKPLKGKRQSKTQRRFLSDLQKRYNITSEVIEKIDQLKKDSQ